MVYKCDGDGDGHGYRFMVMVIVMAMVMVIVMGIAHLTRVCTSRSKHAASATTPATESPNVSTVSVKERRMWC
jgi:hypothetical protein